MRLVRSRPQLLVALLALAASRAAAQAPEPGVLWEHTVQMEMKGFSMPPTTSTFCAPKKGLDGPPQPKSEKSDCRVENLKNDGKTMTWTMVCDGRQKMTGEGRMTYGPKSFDGEMKMRSAEQGEMNMKMSGKLLGTACDAGELKRKVAAVQQQAADAQAQHEQGMKELCERSAKDMAIEMFGPGRMCADPKPLCAQLETREGFQAVAKRGEPRVKQVTQFCGADPDKLRAKLCPPAARDVVGKKPNPELLDFVGESCPDEAKALARAECAGRGYTGMGEGPTAEFCSRYARRYLTSDEMRPKKGAEPAKADAKTDPKSVKDEAIDAGKKKLKGLFGL